MNDDSKLPQTPYVRKPENMPDPAGSLVEKIITTWPSSQAE